MANLNLRTPTGYDGSRATSKRQGITRLATDAEALAGVANNVAVTPAQLSASGDAGIAEAFASPPTLGSTIPNIVNSSSLRMTEAANSKQGVATLVGGTVVVANTSITATSRIQLTAQDLGTITAPSALCVSARVVGTSFTILASQATDTSIVAYEIFEPA